jgi:hypothetical protein
VLRVSPNSQRALSKSAPPTSFVTFPARRAKQTVKETIAIEKVKLPLSDLGSLNNGRGIPLEFIFLNNSLNIHLAFLKNRKRKQKNKT